MPMTKKQRWSGAFAPPAQPATGYGSPAEEMARRRWLEAYRSGAPAQWLSDLPTFFY